MCRVSRVFRSHEFLSVFFGCGYPVSMSLFSFLKCFQSHLYSHLKWRGKFSITGIKVFWVISCIVSMWIG
ncbi:hypothetical protein DL98DRAFT_230993 [Cadophora sp. DSE1049]|nr:hypothetical protein DL98DRAFT_230993 [Cadophora sp. DSE1049]